jgi:hypothetical protein
LRQHTDYPSKKPDFILIGAMKAGTTTLFRRLGEVPGVTLPEIKEPHFFSETWHRGEDWYRSIFETCTGITGEASVSYSDAATADMVARRMATSVPDVRLLYALRDPVARMRSHYVHQVLRTREKRPFELAIQEEGSAYLTSSLYGAVVRAYRQQVDADQMLIFDIARLDDNPSLWMQILTHIGAMPAPMSHQTYNVSAEKPQFTSGLLWLWERGVTLPEGTPEWMRKTAKRILARDSTSSQLVDTAKERIPDAIVVRLREDRALLAEYGIETAWEPFH